MTIGTLIGALNPTTLQVGTQLLSYNLLQQFGSNRNLRYRSKIAWVIEQATLMNRGDIAMLPVIGKPTNLNRLVKQFSE